MVFTQFGHLSKGGICHLAIHPSIFLGQITDGCLNTGN